jgi:DNA phosphorothioation-dependent restriction protein DptH
MNLFINSIKDYLAEKAQNSFTQQYANESRVLVKGLPFEVGKELLSLIIAEGGFKVNDRVIPFVLHDNSLDKSLVPDAKLGGLCGKDHILNLRNTSGIEEIIVVLAVGSSIDKSNKTSFEPIGIEDNISNVEWVGHELIQKVQERLFTPTRLTYVDSKELMHDVLLEYEKLLKHENDHLGQWNLLKKLGENFTIETDQIHLRILLGLIFENQNNISNFERFKDLFTKIADGFESNGIFHSIEEWKKKNISPEVSLALDHFYEHIASVGVSPSEFRRCPYYFYSPELSDVITKEDHWWRILSLEIWNEILEDTTKVEGSCLVEVTNSIYRNSKPCPIVIDEINIKIKNPTRFNEGDVLTVSRKFNKYEIIEKISINETCETIVWQHNPSSHKSPCTFKFSLDGHKDTTCKVISVKNYSPGVAFDIPQMIKATPLKDVSRKNSKNEQWESNILLSNSGSHEMRINYDDEKIILKTTKQKKDNAKDFTDINFLLRPTGTYIVFDLEEESQLELIFEVLEEKIQRTIRVNCSVIEDEPQGVHSVLDKLILQNRSSKGIQEKIDVVSNWSKLHQIQKWYLEDPEKSWQPVIIGSDYELCFAIPWDQNALMSRANINNDFRPHNLSNDCPESIKLKRTEILEFFKKQQSVDGNNTGLIEYQELFNEVKKAELKPLIIEYLNLYLDWYQQAPDLCCWFDVIALTNVTNGNVLENEPFALLLSPFHPLKLAWNFLAQEVLYSTLVNNEVKPCPAAGILDSSRFPDVFLLTCFKAQRTTKDFAFISMETNMKTWGVYWNMDKINYLNVPALYLNFVSSLGFAINGLEGGLSSSQVEQSLDDVFRIKSGQNTINVKVFSESQDLENFNVGVGNWVNENLGEEYIANSKREERDIWYSSGGKKLNIFDTRDINHQPSDEHLLEVSDDSGNSVKWYSNKNLNNDTVDLTIISQLSNESPDLIKSDTNSVIFRDGLTRERIRYSIYNAQDKLSFTETRTSKRHDTLGDDLGSVIIRLCYHIEQNVFLLGRGSLNSTPKLHLIHDALKFSDYCAISSSVVDPAAFFSFESESFLWDYDLPSYSNQHSAHSGFYMLAKSSENVKEAVKNSLKLIPGLGNVKNADVLNVLSEISSRGIPTLKTLASGGTSASGELGMLIAMNLLQSLDNDTSRFQFFPFSDSETINLLIPVDPFRNQINSLMSRLDQLKIRPDLLAFSIRLDNSVVSQIKITPIEIKYRTNEMTNRDLMSAMDQCQVFIKFLNVLNDYSVKSELWKIARNRLLSDMISFAFSTYGRRIKNLNESINWAKLHTEVISKLDDFDKLIIAGQGRLMVTSKYQLTSFEKVISDNDTLLISFDDAKDILLKTNTEKFEVLRSKIGNWGLTVDPFIGNKSQETPKEEVLPQAKVENIEPLDNQKSSSKQEINLNRGIEFEVGVHEGALSELPYLFHPSNTNLNQLNIGIVGDLGTGKTQLIKALIYNIVRYPNKNRGKSPKFLILDTKRDYDGSGDKESDQNFARDINAKVVKPYNLPINLFDIRNSKDDNPAFSKAEFFIDILKKIFGGIGPNQENTILTAVLDSFKKLGYEPYRDNYQDFTSPTLKDIFEEYKLLVGDKVDAPFSLMNKLVMAKYFEEDREKTVDFRDFFNQTVVISLGGIASNDRNLKMVMIFFMNMYREYMLGVKKLEFISMDNYQLRNIDSYLLIDEANLIMEYELPVLEDLLLKGREFGVGIILSSQYLSHFRKSNTNYLEPLLTWFVHKVPNVTIKEIQALGLNNANDLLVAKIKSLECHYCLYKSLGADGIIIKGTPYYKLIEN